jgi:Rrf2 family protein
MRLSSTDVYAFKALAFLGMLESGALASSEQIAQGTGVPKPYLVRLLATLSAKGVLSSRKGISGGYALAKPARELALSDVMRAVDGPIAALSCTSLNWPKTCPEEARCHARGRVWTRVRDAIIGVLETCSVQDLVDDVEQGVDYNLCLDHLLRPTDLAHGSGEPSSRSA